MLSITDDPTFFIERAVCVEDLVRICTALTVETEDGAVLQLEKISRLSLCAKKKLEKIFVSKENCFPFFLTFLEYCIFKL